MDIRNASVVDIRTLAELILLAGEGIPDYIWKRRATAGESVLEFGTREAAREDGGFSYRHARLCIEGDRVLGMVLGYRLPEPHVLGALSPFPALLRPLLRLELRVPGSWYLNGVATFAAYRRRGVARALLEDTARCAEAAGCRRISLIVASRNTAAQRLYTSHGFFARESLPVVPFPGGPPGGDWILMTREF